MKRTISFMGETFSVEGNDLNDYLINAFPRMVEIAFLKYQESAFTKRNLTRKTKFREVAATWFSYYHETKVSKGTARNTRILLNKHILPTLEDEPISFEVLYIEKQKSF